jgi:helicase HerA-like protein
VISGAFALRVARPGCLITLVRMTRQRSAAEIADGYASGGRAVGLGARVRHASRAFTPDGQEALSRRVKTYPTSTRYDLEKASTSLGTGEAAPRSGLVEKVLGNTAVKSFLRSAAGALGREITRGLVGTARKRR